MKAHPRGRRRTAGGARGRAKACGPAYGVPLFGAASTIAERFVVGAVTRFPAGGAMLVERAVLVVPGQPVELLPGWVPLAS